MANKRLERTISDLSNNETLRPLKVGLLCSAFDFLHAGHVKAIEDASLLCDILYLGLHVDPSIERSSKNKPAIPLSERFYQLHALEDKVDFVIPYQYESEIKNIIHLFNIDIVFMGEEYINQEYTVKGMNDIEVCFLKREHGISSSIIRQHIVSSTKQRNSL